MVGFFSEKKQLKTPLYATREFLILLFSKFCSKLDQLEELGPQVWDLCISELIVRAVLDLYDGPKRE